MKTFATSMGIVAAAALAALPVGSAAQSPAEYPARPVKVLVPYAPGGATDIIARHVAAELTDALGQSVVVENRAGASGNVALEAAAKAPPDGYTLLCGNVSTNAINETTFAQTLQTKPSRDLVGIAKLVEIPHIIVVTPAFPAGSVAEMVAEAKQNPGKLQLRLGRARHVSASRHGAAGEGGGNHLDPRAVQGRGRADASQPDGRRDPARVHQPRVVAPAGALRQAEGDRDHRAGATRGAARRGDHGGTGLSGHRHQRLARTVRAGGDLKPVVDKLYAAVAKTLSQPEMKEMLAKQMMTVALSASPEEFSALVQKETREWAEVVRESKIKVD